MNKVIVLGGGTFNHVRNHLSIAVPAFGETAKFISGCCRYEFKDMLTQLHLTKMASTKSNIVTNDDVAVFVESIIEDTEVKVVFFNVALADFTGQIGEVESGKYAPRLKSREGPFEMQLTIADKLLGRIRKHRKDIFLVAFKTTSGATHDEQYVAGLNLLKANSANLVLANDTVTRTNMIICPEEARYCVTTDRELALRTLVEIAKARSNLTFTRSTVVDGPSVDWASEVVPSSLRTVVDYCIEQGAYKRFRGVTAGHFAVKIGEDTFLTSKRKSDFNDLKNVGLVHVTSYDDNNVVAIGAKPSVGGQSQRIIFKEHPNLDCIVHFHCPLKAGSNIPIRPQWMFECGSHECGQNTSSGLKEIEPGIFAVMLEEHGPNIVFNKSIDPQRVIAFINSNFDLKAKTGGLVEPQAVSIYNAS